MLFFFWSLSLNVVSPVDRKSVFCQQALKKNSIFDFIKGSVPCPRKPCSGDTGPLAIRISRFDHLRQDSQHSIDKRLSSAAQRSNRRFATIVEQLGRSWSNFMELYRFGFWRINAPGVRSGAVAREFDSEPPVGVGGRSAVQRSYASCFAKSTGTRSRVFWHRV